jgi:hypothetical protein
LIRGWVIPQRFAAFACVHPFSFTIASIRIMSSERRVRFADYSGVSASASQTLSNLSDFNLLIFCLASFAGNVRAQFRYHAEKSLWSFSGRHGSHIPPPEVDPCTPRGTCQTPPRFRPLRRLCRWMALA